MSQALLHFIGWSVLPNMVSGFLHNLLFKLPINASPPGTTGYARTRRMLYIGVVVAYLAYTVYAAYSAVPENYYELLGISPCEMDDKVLRKQFRRLSQIHHPDKGGDEAQFRVLRHAYDALSDRVVRFGYDRFGAVAATWHDEKTRLAMMRAGLYNSAPFYVGSLIFAIGIAAVQREAYGTYWRTFCLVGLAVLHNAIVCAPSRLTIFTWLFPAKVQFEHVSMLQSLLVTLLVAISQVGPVLMPQQSADTVETWRQLATMAVLVRREASLVLHSTVVPFLRGSSSLRSLQEQGIRWMFKAKLEAEPEMVAAKRDALTAPAVKEQSQRTFMVE